MSSTDSQVVPHRGNASHQNGSGQNVDTQPELNEQQQQQPQQNSVWSILKGLVFRFMVIYFISSLFRRSPQPTNTTAGPMTGLKPSSNLYENGTLMDLYLYISEREFEPNFKDPKELVWLQKDLVYGLWTGGPEGDGSYKHEITIPTSKEVQNNGSLWAHVYVVKSNNLPYHSDQYSEVYTIHKRKRLNRYKKRKYKNTHNLLTGQTANSAETLKKLENNVTEDIISHWHPNLTINIIDDHTAWVRGQVPHPLDEFIEFEPRTGKYWPIIYINDYWNLQRDYTPINDTVKSLPLYVTFHPLSMFRFQLYTAQAMNSKWASMLGTQTEESEEEQDFVKEAFLETSPILLALTVIVSITHSVFEFLAFKNDIQFWKNRSSLEGLSVRSVFFNLFQSVIVLLYVLDNDTNTLIKISIGIGLLIEMWKIHKVVNIQVNREQRMLFGLLPKIVISDKGSYVESSTKVYDHLAFRYLSWLCFPLLIGYAVYSLLYLEHKGLYSWILSMLYGFLLTFGFIMMTPQLFINYKLKSVAHLPWRMLTYKFLNTFIDDIFAFVIKMPTLYRLGCFRDDIIFLIYLYQRWIYRVDPKRVNEFGVSGEDLNNPNAVENSEQVADTATKKEQ